MRIARLAVPLLSLVVLGLTLGLTTATEKQASFRDADRAFEEALRQPELPSSNKRQAIMALARAASGRDVRPAAEKLMNVLRGRYNVNTSSYETQLNRMLQEREQIMTTVRNAGNMITQAQQARMQELDQQILRLQDIVRSNDAIRDAAIQALATMDGEEARALVVRGITDRDENVQTGCLGVARAQKWDGYWDAVVQALDRARGKAAVQVMALVTLRAIDVNRGFEQFRAALDSTEDLVRSQAVRCLREVRRPESIDALIARLAVEVEGVPRNRGTMRIAYDIVGALWDLTGNQNLGPDPSAWATWWNTRRSGFQMPAPRPDLRFGDSGGQSEGPTRAFYGLQILTDRPVFVIDRSGSMLSSADVNDPQADVRGGPLPPPAGKPSKWEALQRELFKTIGELPANSKFAIVWYSTDVSAFQNGALVDANERNRRAAQQEIMAMQADGLTNIQEALELAFRISTGENRIGPVVTGGARLLADTIYFMTDGAPTVGPGLPDAQGNLVLPTNGGDNRVYTQLLLEEISRWNETRNITIHAICVGTGDTAFMQAVAARNNGSYVHVTR